MLLVLKQHKNHKTLVDYSALKMLIQTLVFSEERKSSQFQQLRTQQDILKLIRAKQLLVCVLLHKVQQRKMLVCPVWRIIRQTGHTNIFLCCTLCNRTHTKSCFARISFKISCCVRSCWNCELLRSSENTNVCISILSAE